MLCVTIIKFCNKNNLLKKSVLLFYLPVYFISYLSLSLVANGKNGENLQQKLIQNQKLDDNEQFVKSSQLVSQFNQNAKYIDQYPDVSSSLC